MSGGTPDPNAAALSGYTVVHLLGALTPAPYDGWTENHLRADARFSRKPEPPPRTDSVPGSHAKWGIRLVLPAVEVLCGSRGRALIDRPRLSLAWKRSLRRRAPRD
jgi:hypothetical protein